MSIVGKPPLSLAPCVMLRTSDLSDPNDIRKVFMQRLSRPLQDMMEQIMVREDIMGTTNAIVAEVIEKHLNHLTKEPKYINNNNKNKNNNNNNQSNLPEDSKEAPKQAPTSFFKTAFMALYQHITMLVGQVTRSLAFNRAGPAPTVANQPEEEEAIVNVQEDEYNPVPSDGDIYTKNKELPGDIGFITMTLVVFATAAAKTFACYRPKFSDLCQFHELCHAICRECNELFYEHLRNMHRGNCAI